MSIKAKKHLGQHFLNDENIAKKIADTLSLNGHKTILEIGPGMGVLTKYLLDKNGQLVDFYPSAVDPFDERILDWISS